MAFVLIHGRIAVSAGPPRLLARRLAEEPLSRELCIEWYVDAECDVADLAAHAGCSERTARKVLAMHGIPLRNVRGWQRRAGASRRLTLEESFTKEYLEAEYVTAGRSMRDIAAEWGCSSSSVGFHLRRHQIPTRGGDQPLGVGARLTKALLLDFYVTRRQSTREIAQEVGCSPHAVELALRRHHLPVRPSPSIPSPAREHLTPAFLEREYLERGRSAQDIGRQLGCSRNVVLSALREHGFPVQPHRKHQGRAA